MMRVECSPAKGGCGWWWYRRKVKPHWWSRARYEYDGAHYADDGHGHGLMPFDRLRGHWMSEADMEDFYADCWARIR